jgi:hypothetical protein
VADHIQDILLDIAHDCVAPEAGVEVERGRQAVTTGEAQ